ncbi:MAG TPA: HAD-IC family P-type ATPase, partial [Desulfurivibrionaceae bacterium]|nr:HAD-IC family P-type ATPase [Desulfurivibrionaceae bacterium]
MPYRQTPEEIFAALATSKVGLSSEEAALRLARDGANQLEGAPPARPLLIFLNQFKSFIIYILLFAVGFSLLIGEWVDSIVILVILLANALIGFFQELSANRSLEALKKMAPLSATVRRDRFWQGIDARELVVGDIIRVEAGDKVPADARLLESVRLKADEAMLTGESVPVEKNPEVLVGEA